MVNLHYRLASRRKALAKIHKSPEWKAATKQFKIDHPYCAWHEALGIKIPTFVPHHPDREKRSADFGETAAE